MTTTTTETPILSHKLTWVDEESISIEGQVDRFAILEDERRLMMVSVVMAAQDAKAFRAALSLGLDRPITLKNLEDNRVARVQCSSAGYEFQAVKLGYGMAHAVAVCREPGFLVDDSDEALWRELKSSRFTTPLLRSWLPYIRAQLAQAGKFAKCYNHVCGCGYLMLTDGELDFIVETGLKKKKLKIER